ncbi:MAG: hypothetical protein UY76_C0021G0005 [Candidatus Uhrbacteria bacterium GW2011_GWA2_52_8d]|uniref:TrbC/VIRB2 family protein n=1 Tax=Candidatus Uhrbacteria bacterium GW2011_GWA2_52_8d TaxID=1618979 RepID=A0A0G2AJ85_9BACT|nr:MAG: hypothetical protein UY76_C0021G0005 [Candidatus Uhrbacteria bacterium GW2011_GWA2_52_8d]
MSLGLCALLIGIVIVSLSTDYALAQSATDTIQTGLDSAAEGTYSQNVTATVFIGNLIRALLTATGIIFLVITVYAGVLYMTAMGDDTKIKKAKGMITSSIIGLIIIIGAYALTDYVISALSSTTTATTTT